MANSAASLFRSGVNGPSPPSIVSVTPGLRDASSANERREHVQCLHLHWKATLTSRDWRRRFGGRRVENAVSTVLGTMRKRALIPYSRSPVEGGRSPGDERGASDGDLRATKRPAPVVRRGHSLELLADHQTGRRRSAPHASPASPSGGRARAGRRRGCLRVQSRRAQREPPAGRRSFPSVDGREANDPQLAVHAPPRARRARGSSGAALVDYDHDAMAERSRGARMVAHERPRERLPRGRIPRRQHENRARLIAERQRPASRESPP